MKWQFTKMHGVGNDFVVLDGVRQSIQMTPERARAIAHRQFGIGADQILLVEDPSHPEAHFRYRILTQMVVKLNTVVMVLVALSVLFMNKNSLVATP